MRPRHQWSWLTVDTKLWDDDVLWELPAEERKRVKRAMMWGRPLPRPLARVAVQHAPMMLTQAWYGYALMGVGLIFAAAFGLTARLPTGLLGVVSIVLAADAVLWLFIGVNWLRAVGRARRTARTGHWPERG